uniref:CARD domain-containing protein n=1 Tax=Callorhinchus milii TaxID=7868 RepID=A0A4W3IWP9_CALMI
MAVDMKKAQREIKSKKCELIECLASDPDYILQKVDSKEMLFTHEYQALKAQQNPIKRITDMLDMILGKGEKKCEEFICALKEVQDTYPQLQCLRDKTEDDQDKSTNTYIEATVENHQNESQNKKRYRNLILIKDTEETKQRGEDDSGIFSWLWCCMRHGDQFK